MNKIIIELPEEKERNNWSLPFNGIQVSNIFFYLFNTGDAPIRIDKVCASSTGFGNNVQLHGVLGEPVFHQEFAIKPVNKNIGRNGVLPDIEVYACSGVDDLESIGQLDRVDLRQDKETYTMHPNVLVPSHSSVVLTSESGVLSGIVHISQEKITEE